MATERQPLFTIISSGAPADGPLYRSTKMKLTDAMASGEFPPGSALPAERLLAERFGISIGTLRKAVDELVSEGSLVRQQGRGTFVASHDRSRLLYRFFHIARHDQPKVFPEVEFVAFARAEASAEEAKRLELVERDPVFRIRNRLLLDGRPVIIDDLSISAQRFPRMTENRIRERSSTIYRLYQEAYAITVIRASERVRAVPAPADVAELLQLGTGSPLLEVRRVAMTYHDEPVEWRVSHVDAREHEYISELSA